MFEHHHHHHHRRSSSFIVRRLRNVGRRCISLHSQTLTPLTTKSFCKTVRIKFSFKTIRVGEVRMSCGMSCACCCKESLKLIKLFSTFEPCCLFRLMSLSCPGTTCVKFRCHTPQCTHATCMMCSRFRYGPCSLPECIQERQ